MVHEKLDLYIKNKGIKQSRIADATGISNSLLSQYLSGKVKMPADKFFAICDFLEVSSDTFKPTETTER